MYLCWLVGCFFVFFYHSVLSGCVQPSILVGCSVFYRQVLSKIVIFWWLCLNQHQEGWRRSSGPSGRRWSDTEKDWGHHSTEVWKPGIHAPTHSGNISLSGLLPAHHTYTQKSWNFSVMISNARKNQDMFYCEFRLKLWLRLEIL